MEDIATFAQYPIDPPTLRRNDAANRDPITPQRNDAANRNPITPQKNYSTVRHFTLLINHDYRVSTGVRELPLHYIAGEPFVMKIEDGLIVLEHEMWSLRGEGTTLLEAEQKLLDFAIAISPAYVRHPYNKLTKRAQALKDFLLKVI